MSFDFRHLTVLVVAGCAALPVRGGMAAGPVAPPPAQQEAAAESGRAAITLEEAVARALRSSPAVAAGGLAIAAAEARVTQAGLLPNPSLDLEAENFGGGGAYDGYDAAESTVLISQPILLGGKRDRRRAVAASESRLAGRDLEAVRLDVTAAATAAFYRVLAAQQRVALARELLGLAERFADTVEKRVAAGKVSPVEATRAGIQVAGARVGVTRAARELEAARALLSATWGAASPDFDRAAGELPDFEQPPPREVLGGRLEAAPEVARLDDLVRRRQSVVELERSLRVPDLTVSVGPRRFADTGESAWVAGLSLPIPIFDRNQGARRAAEFELERTRRDVEAVRVALEARLTALYESLRAVTDEGTALAGEIVPASEIAFAAITTGYREGKLGFLEVLDAQRSLFEARSLLLDSHEEYAVTRTELERLIANPMDGAAGPSPSAADPEQGDER